MLIEFSITNFLSFKERTTFSMIASSDNTLEDNYVNIGNEKLLKITSIYGSNASGKSNLFKALSIICNMIKFSNFNSPNDLLSIIPFKLYKETLNKPSDFEIKFLIDGVRYIYGFSADKKNIYKEYLIYYPNGRPVKIFNRENISDYSFNHSDEKFLNDLKEKNGVNKFFLATATNWNFDKTKKAFEFITERVIVVMSYEKLNSYSYDLYHNDLNRELQNFALKFLEKADFNIKGYKVIKNKNDDNLSDFMHTTYPEYKVKTIHEVNGDKYEFDILEESLGTQVIFSLIPLIKDTIDKGKVLFIDEFDRSMHPYIIKFIVELFNDNDFNKMHAQLIFNTHDTNLLDLDILRRDQIWFTEKNIDNGESVLYALDDFSVRKDENIEKGYLLGRYGAVPFLINNFDDFYE